MKYLPRKCNLTSLISLGSLLLGLYSVLLGAELKLASYNIKHGRNMNGKITLADTGNFLKKLNADVIALQEVDNKCTRSGKVDQAATLGKQLGMHHAFGKFFDYQGGEYGMALLSKHPILEVKKHKLPDGAEPRIALEIIIEPEKGKKVSCISIHFDYTSEKRRQPQIKTLLKALETTTHPIALIGDFNTTPESESIALFKNHKSNGQGGFNVPKKGNAVTFPSDKPRVEIDYFMLRGFKEDATCTVLYEKFISDHRPLVTKVRY